MITQEQQTQSKELIAKLIQKAWETPEFKEQLVKNPSETISKIIGKELGDNLPSGKELVVVDQSDVSKYYLNIPAKPELNTELIEEELDQISGGVEDPVYSAGKDFANWCEDTAEDIGDWFSDTF